MNSTRTARPALTVSAAFLLALGASGVAASAAFADSHQAPAATTPSTSDTEPTFTLVSSGAGSFELTLTVPGTSIAVTYAVDPTGAVTAATTSTVGASVVADGDELKVSLADGRVIDVELGKSGTTVDEVEVDEPGEHQAEADNQDDNNQSVGADESNEADATAESDSDANDNAEQSGQNASADSSDDAQTSDSKSGDSEGSSDSGSDSSSD